MTIQVTGKNVEVGDAFTSYISDKVVTVLGKYLGPEIAGHVRLEKVRSEFMTACSIRLKSGLVLEANGEGGDAYSSADAALEHLEKRVRRHKRRLKSHHNGREVSSREIAASDYTVRVDSEDEESDEAGYPVIIAETERGISEMPVSEAVMQLDVTESPFLVFRNASHGDLNIVYRRSDGHIGWIDPKTGAKAGKGAHEANLADRNRG
jgi:ribosomal subunit interface protein